MTKKTKPKLRQERPRSPKPEKTQMKAKQKKNHTSTAFSYAWKIFVGFAVILGVVASLKPKPVVAPSTYLDPSDPLKALFTVTNDGFLSLQNVQASCAVRNVTLVTGMKIVGTPDFTSRLVNPTHASKELASDESDTVYCALGALDLHAPIESADIAIVVDYSTFGIHWPAKIYPFTTQRDVSGQLHWIKHPLNK
jgi:hypothetical protein